jgi:hypothetical protein
MVNVRGLGRLGMLAVGLGIGAAVAHMPVASADSSTDWLSSIDGLLGGALPAPATSGLDLDISVDGYQLLDLGSGATATSGMGDFAIAFGAGSTATAEGGYGDYATATGGATAIAGDPNAGATGNNFDFASASGDGSGATAGNDFFYPDTTGSSFDYASANSGSATGTLGAEALAGFNGSGDSASSLGLGAFTEAGLSYNAADPANYDSASVWGNLTTPVTGLDEANAGGDGINPDGGSSDTAFVIDPFGTVGSTATAGLGFNSDLAGVFGDGLNATATTANNLVDILPSL